MQAFRTVATGVVGMVIGVGAAAPVAQAAPPAPKGPAASACRMADRPMATLAPATIGRVLGCLHDQVRTQHGLARLTWSVRLRRLGDRQARDMRRRSYLGCR